MDTTRDEFPSGLQHALTQLAHRYGIREVYVFGSRAGEVAGRVRGESPPVHSSGSDVDIGIRPAPGHSLSAQDRVRLTIELEDLLAAPRVDLVLLPQADPFLAVDVIRGEILFCADPYEQAEYELYVLRRAGDLAPYAHARIENILGGGAP